MPQLYTQRHWQAMDMALELLDKHGIGDTWSVEMDRAKTRLGSCQYRKRVITLSSHFIAAQTTTVEKLQDTILHEIAHAIVGPANGHGMIWQRKCVEIGARPIRCGQAFPVQAKYLFVCPTCANQARFHRKIKRNYVCARCPNRPRLVAIGAQS